MVRIRYAVIFRSDLLHPMLIDKSNLDEIFDELKWMIQKYGPPELIYSIS